jgi:hypothetical protein
MRPKKLFFLIKLWPQWKASNSRAKYLDRDRNERGQTCIVELQRMRDKQRILLNLAYRLVPFTCSDFPSSLNIPWFLFPLSSISRLTLFDFFLNIFYFFFLSLFGPLLSLSSSASLCVSRSRGECSENRSGKRKRRTPFIYLSFTHTHTHTHTLNSNTHTHTNTNNFRHPCWLE